MNIRFFRAAICALALSMAAPVAAQVEIGFRSVHSSQVGDSTFLSPTHCLHNGERHPGGYVFDLGFLTPNISEYQDNNDPRFKIHLLGGLGVGFINTPGAPDNMNTAMGRSVEVDWSNIVGLGVRAGKHGEFTLGMGLLWRNYKMTDTNLFRQDAQGNLSIESYPMGSNPKFSRLHTTSLTLPLQYRHTFKHGWRIALGPELAFNCLKDKRYSLKTRYTLADQQQKEDARGVHVNDLNVNLYASVMWKHRIGLYMRWSPSNVMDTSYGPEFQSLSVGFRIFQF